MIDGIFDKLYLNRNTNADHKNTIINYYTD